MGSIKGSSFLTLVGVRLYASFSVIGTYPVKEYKSLVKCFNGRKRFVGTACNSAVFLALHFAWKAEIHEVF